jgi:hypothetical protein
MTPDKCKESIAGVKPTQHPCHYTDRARPFHSGSPAYMWAFRVQPEKRQKAWIPTWLKLILAIRRVTRKTCRTQAENELSEIASSLQHIYGKKPSLVGAEASNISNRSL